MQPTVPVQTDSQSITVQPGELRIIASPIEARPMSFIDNGERQGYEPAVARAVCDRLGLQPRWFDVPLKDFYTELSTGHYDIIWFNQTITQERRAWADFTRPYGRFDTAVLVREDSPIERREDLSGQCLGVLSESVSQRLIETFPPDVDVVFFEGTERVNREIILALHRGVIDAFLEDALVLMAAEAQDRSVRVAFEIPTQRPFGVGVLPGNRELLEALNETLNSLLVDGTLKKLWGQWIPYKPYPF